MLISPLIAEHSNKNLVVLYRLYIQYSAKIEVIKKCTIEGFKPIQGQVAQKFRKRSECGK